MLIATDSSNDRACALASACPAQLPDEYMAAEWTDLALNAAEANPFLEPWFAVPALKNLRGKAAIWQIDVRQNGRLTALMHFNVHHGYGRIPVSYVGNWSHYQCFMGTPLIRKGHEADVWQAVLSLLDKSSWAPNFLSLSGLDADGPVVRALMMARQSAAIVHRHHRAMLASELSAEDYLESALRGKKRKELRRLANRLRDEGMVSYRTLSNPAELDDWCATFLALEAKGWKGSDGAALSNSVATSEFFREIMVGAFNTGRLDFQRLDLDERAIAMLVNFRTPPGSWSFKIAFDEELARYSPGVMIELENLARVQSDADLDWMDSCAAENHPMIDRLWRERREIVQVTVPIAGARNRAIHALCRTAENSSAYLKSLLKPQPAKDEDHA